ncbi:MAG TPA: aromatic amino acid lyase, partial [Actinomycetes bacterium]|nr:aromatic amino acid lyase [Actinomycetes bacterium]
VSMGWSAGRKLVRAVDAVGRVLAVEVLSAARALDLRAPLEPAAGTGAARTAVRAVAQGPGPDRFLAPDIEAVRHIVCDGSLTRAVETVTGALD